MQVKERGMSEVGAEDLRTSTNLALSARCSRSSTAHFPVDDWEPGSLLESVKNLVDFAKRIETIFSLRGRK